VTDGKQTAYRTKQIDGLSIFYREAGPSDAPVLLLSGEIDPVTPPSFAEEVAKTLSRSLALTVPGEGHGVLGRSCVARLAADFLERADVKDLDAGCIQGKRPMRFFTSFAGPPP